MTDTNLICVAAIAGAFGVKGEIKIKSFTDSPEACLDFGPLLDKDGKVFLTPTSHRKMNDFLAVCAPQVKTREEAQALKSTKLYVPRAAFPEAEEDEFYIRDLIGMEVKTTDGKRMGTIIAVQDFGAGEMLEIKPKDKASFYQPFTKKAVPKIDQKAGRVVIKIIETD
jgi:16S rRNA processing protein RimM